MTSATPGEEQNTNLQVEACTTHCDVSTADLAGAVPIAVLNDAFRRSFNVGRVVETVRVLALPEDERIALLLAVRRFDNFGSDNDPHGEHDYGAVEVGGRSFFWKIDAYDHDLRGHSSHPADPAVTTRVLTIMLAEEY